LEKNVRKPQGGIFLTHTVVAEATYDGIILSQITITMCICC